MELVIRATEQDGKRVFFAKKFGDMVLRNLQTAAVEGVANKQPRENQSDQ